MPRALSQDLRDRVVGAVRGGLSRRAAAEQFEVSIASAIRWCAVAGEDGRAVARCMGGDRRSWRIEACHDRILSLVAGTPDMTLSELGNCLAEEGHVFCITTLHNFLRRHGYTRKKRPVMPKNRTGKTS